MIATHPLCLTLSLRALVEHHDVLLLGAAAAEQPCHVASVGEKRKRLVTPLLNEPSFYSIIGIIIGIINDCTKIRFSITLDHVAMGARLLGCCADHLAALARHLLVIRDLD